MRDGSRWCSPPSRSAPRRRRLPFICFASTRCSRTRTAPFSTLSCANRAAANGENLWSGQLIETINAAGVRKQVQFTSNLPSNTASRSVLIATRGIRGARARDAQLHDPRAVRSHRWRHADVRVGYRSDRAAAAADRRCHGDQPQRHAGQRHAAQFRQRDRDDDAQPVGSVEFFNQALDHYFISALAPDIDALDSGRHRGLGAHRPVVLGVSVRGGAAAPA